jgi:5-methylcytosine-specific restriction enzyme A
MPNSTLKPCAYPGCSNLVKRGYCDQHTAPIQFNRDPERQALYGTRLWKRIRERQLAREPWCAECLKAGRYTPATDVDHIEAHKGNKEMFFRGPFQSLCHVCHTKKTNAEMGRGGKNV